MTISATTVRQAPNLTAAFAQVCRLHPDRVAVRDRGTSVTYRQLARRVEELAAGLSSLPAPPARDRLVAVALEPGTDAVAAVLATLAVGCPYLPLDPAAPDGYLADVLTDARPHALIASSRQSDCVPAAVLDIDDLAACGRDRSAPQHGAAARAADPAYAVFTSGSTGRPKGVLLPHTALLHSTAARIDAYGTPGRVPLLHSPAVDVYTGTLFWALLSGATLVIAPAGLRDVPATARLLHDEEITDLVYLSSLYPVLLDCLQTLGGRPAGLRRVMIGSERWGESVIDRHAALLPEVELYNEYGPTETAVWSSGACVWDGAGRRAPMTIGRPVAGTGYRLLDADAQPVGEPGQRGELYITGAQLAIGYLAQPELTTERFVTLDDGARAYRTGDLVELTEDGVGFVFAGRVDRQLKVQGQRVEPAHVESVLMAHPHVGLAHVTARRDPVAGSVLAAYLTPRADGPPPDTAVVGAFAAERLPSAMVPRAWVVLEELPRTAAGKIDERALPAPSAPAGTGSGRDGDGPADEIERALAAAAAELLGGQAPGVTCDLRQLGASSLVLIRLAARITAEFGVDVPVSALFAHPTIRQIAHQVRTAQPTGRPPLVVAASHDPDGTPLSAQQRQIWFLGQLAPDSLAYNTQCSLHLHGPLDTGALEAALSLIVERHEILRTTFHDRPTGPVQSVHAPWRVRLETVDLTALPEQDREEALARYVTDDSQQIFDVGRLPLVRWTLYRLGAERWTLFQAEHHFVHDGWSAVRLLGEIRDAYAAFAAGRPPQLPDLPVQYRDFAAWQHAWTSTGDYARQRAYWQRTLQGAPEQGVTFAEDFPRPARQTFNGACVRADVPAATVDAIDALAAPYGATRFAAFLTAFTLLVRSHTGDSDLVIGSALANRREQHTEHLLGMFVNALPLRLQIREGDTIAAAAAHAMDVLLGAQDHQEFPLTEIIKDLGVRRDPARNPLFQVMFAFHDSPRPVFDAAGMRGRLHIDHNGSAKNDINVVCVPRPPAPGSTSGHDGVEVLWEYNRDLFTPQTAQHLLDCFVRILHTLTDPQAWQQPATALEALDPTQTARILDLAAGPATASCPATLHEGVGARIEQCPQAAAVVQGGRTLTYADLDHAATTLEAQLDALGAGPGGRVAVACGPGPEHVAALLAVLRRGAAYVCLDPAEPAERAAAILADAQPAAVICTSRTAPRVRDLAPGRPLVVAGQEPAPPAPAPLRRPDVQSSDTAYLVYTSGSTGRPKAVVATHAGAVTALTARTAFTGAEPARTLVTLPLQFDVAASMIFWTLWTGGTLAFPDTRDDVRDPAAVRRLIDTHGITRVNFVASFYRHFLAALPDGWAPALATVAIGGERCTRELVEAHAAQLPGVVLDNEYGPTEATVWCAAARLHSPQQPTDSGRVTVGRPLAGYQLYVLDPNLRPVPIGARGELCVAGPAVAAGYLNQPELTAERFVTPHAGPLAGVRLYRTGDVGRLLPSGQFDLVGRVDDQVKIRGFRIELGEVQRCLASHPAATDACVIADHTADPAGQLIAYLAAPAAPPGFAAEVRAWAAERLPTAMVPADVVALEALPLTAAGKVDRAALPAPQPPGLKGGETDGAEGDGLSRVQRTVLAVWSRILGREKLGLDEEWFALGGDSLMAIQATGCLRENGLPVTVADLLQAATPRALAARLEAAPAEDGGLERRPGGTVLPLTGAQAWFFAQSFAEPDHFNQARLFPLPDDAPTRPEDVRDVLDAVLGRHDAFRTRFARRPDGTWSAVLLESTGPAVLEEHLVQPGDSDPDAEILDRSHRGFDLVRGPLWRAVLFTDPVHGRRWLHLVAHHLITDAVSWEVLARDLSTACRRGSGALPVAPGISDDLVARPPQAEEAAYWEDLAGSRTPRLCNGGGERVPYGKLDHYTGGLSDHATAYLLETAQREDASVPGLLLAALHYALAPLSRGDGLYVFVESHGRHDVAAADQIVGWLTSIYPVHLVPGRRHRGLVDTARAFTRQLETVPRQGTGFAAARYLAPASPLGTLLAKTAMPEVTFNYLGHTHPGGTSNRVPMAAGEGIGAGNVLPTAVHVTAHITDGVLGVRFSVDPHLLPPGTAEQAAARMLGALEEAARLVPLAPPLDGAGARPHFLVHPVDGRVDCYRPLAETLNTAGWDCYGLPAVTGPDAATTIDALAAQYVERLRRVQPTGPYTLTGYSFGAAVAFAMARALEDVGERVDKLVLLDPPPPRPSTAGRVGVLAGHVAALLPDRSIEQIQAVIAAATDAHPETQYAILADRLALAEPADTFAMQRLPVLLRHHRALATWQPHGTVAHLHLVQPNATAGHHLDGWLDHGRTVARSVVPGDHHTMLRDDALPHLAAVYRDSVRRPS
ncbi:amino acid adenylation domain-containing protein [Streptomyces sp. NPDC006624]|uniref:amino acid adenylation domain-containing protein n=1 Tax=Streptomyces sp. NPDC006624 TaxID=3154892 RepID=UPI0033AE3614